MIIFFNLALIVILFGIAFFPLRNLRYWAASVYDAVSWTHWNLKNWKPSDFAAKDSHTSLQCYRALAVEQ